MFKSFLLNFECFVYALNIFQCSGVFVLHNSIVFYVIKNLFQEICYLENFVFEIRHFQLEFYKQSSKNSSHFLSSWPLNTFAEILQVSPLNIASCVTWNLHSTNGRRRVRLPDDIDGVIPEKWKVDGKLLRQRNDEEFNEIICDSSDWNHQNIYMSFKRQQT